MKSIQKHVTMFPRDIPVKDFEGTFQAWHTRLHRRIIAGREYLDILIICTHSMNKSIFFQKMSITFIMNPVITYVTTKTIDA